MATKKTKPSSKSAKKAAKRGARKKSKPGTKPFVPTKFAADGKTPLLSGGNPQIAKADGDAPVQAYIAAMPSWKGEVGRRLDELIERTVPEVKKAVRWNSPFYGVEGPAGENWGWILSYHCFAKYVKLTFHNGASLKPPPPGEYKDPSSRFLNIYENDLKDGQWDERQLTAWIRQAAKIPGWIP